MKEALLGLGAVALIAVIMASLFYLFFKVKGNDHDRPKNE